MFTIYNVIDFHDARVDVFGSSFISDCNDYLATDSPTSIIKRYISLKLEKL